MVIRPTVGAISGTNWMAEAPVPITATLRPARSRSWRQVAEWKTGPSKESSPGTSGSDGSESAPDPRTSTSAVHTPFVVVTRQCCAVSDHVASRTSWWLRVKRARSWRRDTDCRYAWISGCAENERVQSGFGANENE